MLRLNDLVSVAVVVAGGCTGLIHQKRGRGSRNPVIFWHTCRCGRILFVDLTDTRESLGNTVS
jgi:hypothetical protein